LLEALSEKLNAARAATDLYKAWFVEQQNIKKAFAPCLWASLSAQIEQGCEQIGRDAGVRLLFDNTTAKEEVRIKNATTGSWILLKFDASGLIIWFQTPGPNGHYGFKVNEDGNGVKFLDPKKDEVLFADELVERILKHVC
jgi:hypothetical protein